MCSGQISWYVSLPLFCNENPPLSLLVPAEVLTMVSVLNVGSNFLSLKLGTRNTNQSLQKYVKQWSLGRLFEGVGGHYVVGLCGPHGGLDNGKHGPGALKVCNQEEVVSWLNLSKPLPELNRKNIDSESRRVWTLQCTCFLHVYWLFG